MGQEGWLGGQSSLVLGCVLGGVLEWVVVCRVGGVGLVMGLSWLLDYVGGWFGLVVGLGWLLGWVGWRGKVG